MAARPRIYISAPADQNLDTKQLALKRAVLDAVKREGFEPQEFFVSGLLLRRPFGFASALDVMSRCHGAVVLALGRWHADTASGLVTLPTEWNHFEGALAHALGKELLIIREEHVISNGITWDGGGQIVLRIPVAAGPEWFTTEGFSAQFEAWAAAIRSRHHVFVGYSSSARSTANDVIKYLTGNGVAVRDWETHFHPGGTILDEIESAARLCLGGVFLFTKDDDLLTGETHHAAPRDNVIFEAGYFMQAKGRERVLIIREEGAKMPADVGGSIYLTLKDRTDITPIQAKLRDFVENRI